LSDNHKVSFVRIHRATLLVSVLLIASITVSVYFGSFKPKATKASIVSDSLVFSIELDKTEFVQQEEKVNITFSMTNTSNEMVKLQWSSFYIGFNQTLYFDYYILDANGTHVYKWSYWSAAFLDSKTMILKPNEQLTNTYRWPQVYDRHIGLEAIVPRGTYSIAGLTRGITLTSESQNSHLRLETPSITFTIR